LVQFFYWLRDWRALNPDAYDNAVDAAEGLLRVEGDVLTGTNRCRAEHDVALSLYRSAMNHIHAMVFSIEHPVEVVRLRNALATLQRLLLAHVAVVSDACRAGKSQMPSLSDPAAAPMFDSEAASRFAVY
jgi:hypothetical protein